MIPKIVHQTAPTDKQNWHYLWHKCQQSWLSNFSDFEYFMWNDEQIDDLEKNHYNNYWDMYNSFNIHILKIDFVRFCILHRFGGIYADMDYFCYKNFYGDLKKDIYLVENPYGNDPIENSLMCSIANHPFWIECMDSVVERYNFYKNNFPHRLKDLESISLDIKNGLKIRPWLVFNISGTNLISNQFRITNYDIGTLSAVEFNNNDISYDKNFKAKHVHTGLWGRESIALHNYLEENKKFLRNISVEEFCFYTDYTNGNFLKERYNDFGKNDSDHRIKLKNKYQYE